MKPCTIIIPNRSTWDAVCLTIESILKQTAYPDYKIMVVDNSNGEGDGNRLNYLKEKRDEGLITLVENRGLRTSPLNGKERYGHGENIRVGLKHCTTPLAYLLSAGTEVIAGDWIQFMVGQINNWSVEIGVARFIEAHPHFKVVWGPPRWIPNWMLLNMPLYRKFQSEEDWDLDRIPLTEFRHKHLFDKFPPLANPDPVPEQVFGDTGWKLWERLEYDNPYDYKMVRLQEPARYLWTRLAIFDGIDRNSHRPEHEHMKKRMVQVADRLKRIRGQ